MIGNGQFRRIQAALAYAATHLDEDVSLGVLAGRAGLSPFHLQRVFAALAGETPKQLTLRLRLERAAAMLLTRDDTVLDIALSCGFQSHEVFCRTFRRRFGMTPKAYRARGFVNGVSRAQGKGHAQLVDRIGPCVGLYHINEPGKSERSDMAYSVTKRELSPQPVLIVRRRVKRSEIAAAIGSALPHIFQYAQQNGIALAGHPFTRYVDAGPGLMTIEPGMRIVASGQDAVSIDPAWTQASGEGEVVRDVLPGGPAAATTHAGPYDTLSEAYAAVQEWIEKERLAVAGAPWECYVTDPGETPDPKDWKTDVFWPLQS
jgi:AraC family transcriptional regulator